MPGCTVQVRAEPCRSVPSRSKRSNQHRTAEFCAVPLRAERSRSVPGCSVPGRITPSAAPAVPCGTGPDRSVPSRTGPYPPGVGRSGAVPPVSRSSAARRAPPRSVPVFPVTVCSELCKGGNSPLADLHNGAGGAPPPPPPPPPAAARRPRTWRPRAAPLGVGLAAGAGRRRRPLYAAPMATPPAATGATGGAAPVTAGLRQRAARAPGELRRPDLRGAARGSTSRSPRARGP